MCMYIHKYVVENDVFGLKLNKNIEDEEYLLEQVVDRVMIRRPGDKPVAEMWHRDVAMNAKPTDKIFGGWINLDPHDFEPQNFSCVLGSSVGCPFTMSMSRVSLSKLLLTARTSPWHPFAEYIRPGNPLCV